MINQRKLSQDELNLLGLIRRSEEQSKRLDGFANCSKQCWNLLQRLPERLVERLPNDDGDGGIVRLTTDGNAVVDFCCGSW